MSDEDDAESVAMSDSDRLDEELKSLSCAFMVAGAAFFTICWVVSYIIFSFLQKG